MTKRASLTKLGLGQHIATKGEPAVAAAKKRPSKKAAAAADSTRHIQTRMNDAGWHALKVLALEQRSSLQALMIEALNDLLKKYRKAAVVEGPSED